MPSFTDLGVAPERAARLADRGIVEPSPIQALALPAIAEGRDALLAAQTGSGKTLAYMLPALQRLEAAGLASRISSASGGGAATPALLVLVPTQELGIQVRDVARWLLEGSGRTVVELIGGANPARQAEKLKRGADVVVGTAGRIVDMMSRGKLSLARCRVVVLDEVDQLADKTHRADVTAVLAAAPAGRQVLAASATLDEAAGTWAAGFMREPARLAAEAQLTLPASLRHQAFVADDRDQLPLLRKLLTHLAPTGAIAFYNRGADIDWLVAKLRHHGVRAAGLHAGVPKTDRAEAMRAFRAGQLQLLVATELAARGLDLGGVTLVFNLDLPRGPAEYVHRVGRTARMGREGTAISFADPKEAFVLGKLEKALGIVFERPVYVFGELREATEADARREARKARAKVAKEQAPATPAKKGKKKEPTARQKAKGKARKAERKATGKFKKTEKPPTGGSAPDPSSGSGRPAGGSAADSSSSNP